MSERLQKCPAVVGRAFLCWEYDFVVFADLLVT